MEKTDRVDGGDLDTGLNSLFNSPIAAKVRFTPRIVVYRSRCSLSDVVRIKEQRKLGPLPESDLVCELQIGSHILAKGQIITKDGNAFFKVEQEL